jgi:hypothetical protein
MGRRLVVRNHAAIAKEAPHGVIAILIGDVNLDCATRETLPLLARHSKIACVVRNQKIH